MDELTRKVLIELMAASGHVDPGDIEPDELLPEKIAADLDYGAILQIKKALYFASNRAPVVMRQAQESAKHLIGVLDHQNQMTLGETA